MKLAFIGDNDLPGIERDAQFAKNYGFAGIEYNFWHGINLTDQTVAQMRSILDRNQVRAAMVGLWGLNHISLDAAEREKAHAFLNRAIDVAQKLGADTLVTGAGDLPGESMDRKIAEFQKVFPSFFDRAKKANLNFAFYALHGGSFIDSIGTCERIWQVVPEMRLKFDAANWQHAGHDYLDLLHRHGDKVGYIHIKEHLVHNGQLLSQPAAGMGDIAWGKIFAFLYEHNYSGWLSVEPHGPLWGTAPLREKMLLLSKGYISQFLCER